MCRALKIYSFLFFINVQFACAQAPPSQLNSELNLKGLKQEQIAEKFGKPDQVSVKSKSQFQWIYGQSIVFFQDDLVVAWSDNGDLSSRANLETIRDSSNADYADFIKKWKNPWTPIEVPEPKNVIQEMLKESVD